MKSQDPDTRAHHAKQDVADRAAQRAHRTDLARSTHGKARAALWGLEQRSGDRAEALHLFKCLRSDLSTYLNRMFQKYREQGLFRAAMTAGKLELEELFQATRISSEIKAIENSLEACGALSDVEAFHVRELLLQISDAVDDYKGG